MVKGFVLIEVRVGKSQDVADELASLDFVKRVDRVTGPHDIIATVEGPDSNKVGNLVVDHMHPILGITRTITCFSLNGKAGN